MMTLICEIHNLCSAERLQKELRRCLLCTCEKSAWLHPQIHLGRAQLLTLILSYNAHNAHTQHLKLGFIMETSFGNELHIILLYGFKFLNFFPLDFCLHFFCISVICQFIYFQPFILLRITWSLTLSQLLWVYACWILDTYQESQGFLLFDIWMFIS